MADFRAEVGVISSLRHPHILLFMGACTTAPHFALVTEHLSRGALWATLHAGPPHPPTEPLPRALVLRVARGVAQGMAYLHSARPPILHRDLKSGNVLLDDAYSPRISDFGLA